MVKYFISKQDFLNIKKKNNILYKIKKYLIDSSYKQIIFSKKGFFEYCENKGLIQSFFQDKFNNNYVKVGKYKLLCDDSKINYDFNSTHQLPIDHILVEYKINKYRLQHNSQIEMYLEFDENQYLTDIWFEANVNIGIHGLGDIEALLDELN
jgi:hypothetical protein